MRQALYYNELDDPATHQFYVGQDGTLPRKGERVLCINALTDSEQLCAVARVFPDTHEYMVRPVRQPSLF